MHERDRPMKKTLLSTTAMILVAGALSAQSIADQVITALQADGYERIEIDNGPSTIKVEAIRGDRKLEIIYDAITGEILEQESGPVEAREDRAPGVFIDDENDDDERDDDEDDESDDDESDDDESDDEDDR